MTDQEQITLDFVRTMPRTNKQPPARSRQNAPPEPDGVAKYTQRFSEADHAWFSALALRDKRSLNSWVYAAASKAAGLADPNFRLSPARKPKGT